MMPLTRASSSRMAIRISRSSATSALPDSSKSSPSLCVAHDRGEGLVDFMNDGGTQLSGRREAPGVSQLLALPLRLQFRQPPTMALYDECLRSKRPACLQSTRG